MAQKKLDDLSLKELKDMLIWYEKRSRYVRFLIQDKFKGGN